eukprot:s2365_g2.t1
MTPNLAAGKTLAVVHQTFTQQRRLLFGNQALDLKSRVQLFDTIVCGALTYGSESWVLATIQDKHKVHAGVMRLYRRLLKVKPDAKQTDEDIVDALSIATPTELLRKARLRYFSTLLHCRASAEWGLIGQDVAWLTLLKDDFHRMWMQLCAATSLPDPALQFGPWHYLIKYHPGYWKRLINRAAVHAIRQRANLQHVVHLHRRAFATLQYHGTLAAPELQATAVLMRLLVTLVACNVV